MPCPAVPRSFSFSPPSARPQPPPGHLGHFGDPLLPGCRRRHLVVPSRPAPRRPRPAAAPAPRAAPPRAVAGVTAARPGSARHGRWPPQGPLRASPGGAVRFLSVRIPWLCGATDPSCALAQVHRALPELPLRPGRSHPQPCRLEAVQFGGTGGGRCLDR